MIDARIALLLAFVVLSTTPPALTRAMAESPYPTPTRDGRERILRTGTCPTGYVGKGAFCEALHQDTSHAFPVIPGKTCPSGTFRSGDACKAFR
ncbi:hypothetical protein AB7M42_004219 [Bradyrhizobium diazoefficiens]